MNNRVAKIVPTPDMSAKKREMIEAITDLADKHFIPLWNDYVVEMNKRMPMDGNTAISAAGSMCAQLIALFLHYMKTTVDNDNTGYSKEDLFIPIIELVFAKFDMHDLEIRKIVKHPDGIKSL